MWRYTLVMDINNQRCGKWRMSNSKAKLRRRPLVCVNLSICYINVIVISCYVVQHTLSGL